MPEFFGDIGSRDCSQSAVNAAAQNDATCLRTPGILPSKGNVPCKTSAFQEPINGIVDTAEVGTTASLGGTVMSFAQGTLISAASGAVRVQDLTKGDLVETRDGGLQPIVWLGQTTVAAQGDLAPIVITKGTFGNTRDLVVSLQQEILLTDWRAELLFGQDEVLVRAVDLLGDDGVYRKTGGTVTYCHILFDAHHLVCAEGLWSESLDPGDMTLPTVNLAVRKEITTLFPDLDGYGPKAAPCLRGYEAACLHV